MVVERDKLVEWEIFKCVPKFAFLVGYANLIGTHQLSTRTARSPRLPKLLNYK